MNRYTFFVTTNYGYGTECEFNIETNSSTAFDTYVSCRDSFNGCFIFTNKHLAKMFIKMMYEFDMNIVKEKIKHDEDANKSLIEHYEKCINDYTNRLDE